MPKNSPPPAPAPLPLESVTFPRQPLPEDDDAPDPDTLVFDYELHQIVVDVAGGQRATEQLIELFKAAHVSPHETPVNFLGLSVLMEGMQQRLGMAVDGLVDASQKLGFTGARELPGVQS